MPHLHCPRCHRTAWVRAYGEQPVRCRGCGSALGVLAGADARLTTAVRERFARDALRDAGRQRFVRDSGPPHRLSE